MEAYAELLDMTGDAGVRTALAESIDLTRAYFFTDDPAQWANERALDWSPLDPPDVGLSYGHAVEFAWLLLRAETVLGRTPSVEFLTRTVDQALEHCWDARRGGLYDSAPLAGPSHDTDKHWWAQAEMLAALTDAACHHPGARYEHPIGQLLAFVDEYVVDPVDGVWRESVAADGGIRLPAKAHNWVGGYHDLRAIVKFWRAYGGEPT
jgi:mannose/cellobiose epimerase-like protein (N-acyl-D-glucosamine 2-epimerase family)